MSLENILSDFNSQFENVENKSQIDDLRVNFLGKKSALNDLFGQLKNLTPEEKKAFGARINDIRNFITQKIEEKKNYFENLEFKEIVAVCSIFINENKSNEKIYVSDLKCSDSCKNILYKIYIIYLYFIYINNINLPCRVFGRAWARQLADFRLRFRQ
mgnify:CR=1 FL=1